MAKQKVNTDLITCDAFWQPEKPGDKIAGVLLTMNMVEDLKAKTGYRPLYVIALLEAKPKNCYLEKQEVKDLKKGDIVGVNGAAKIDMAIRKLGGAKKVCGHEIDIEFLGKSKIETGKSKGNDIKNYDFTWDDTANKEFAGRVVMPDPFMKGTSEEDAPF